MLEVDRMRDIVFLDIFGIHDAVGEPDGHVVNVWFPPLNEDPTYVSLLDSDAESGLEEIVATARDYATARAAGVSQEIEMTFGCEEFKLEFELVPAGYASEPLVGVAAFLPDPANPSQTFVNFGIVHPERLLLWCDMLEAQLETADWRGE